MSDRMLWSNAPVSKTTLGCLPPQLVFKEAATPPQLKQGSRAVTCMLSTLQTQATLSQSLVPTWALDSFSWAVEHMATCGLLPVRDRPHNARKEGPRVTNVAVHLECVDLPFLCDRHNQAVLDAVLHVLQVVSDLCRAAKHKDEVCSGHHLQAGRQSAG